MIANAGRNAVHDLILDLGNGRIILLRDLSSEEATAVQTLFQNFRVVERCDAPSDLVSGVPREQT